MARSIQAVLGGRYRLTGELARGASVQRGWDRWLNRGVFIEILASTKIDDSVAKQRFIATAGALVRIEHPNVESLLDYGATADGAPYHVMSEAGVELATLTREGRVSWIDTRKIMLDVIAGVDALHRQRIVHGDISPHSVALFAEAARLVEFGDAEQRPHELSLADTSVDVYGVAALGFTLLTGSRPTGPTASLVAALATVQAPSPVRTLLLRALSEPEAVTLASLRRAFGGRSRSFACARLIDAAAAVAAAAMLSLGLWSSVAASTEASASAPEIAVERTDGATCEHGFESSVLAMVDDAAEVLEHDAMLEAPAASDADEAEAESQPLAPTRSFVAARARTRVGSEAQRNSAVTVHSERFDLNRELSPATLVERGIDLTHGRPTPEDDPRLPIVDGPLRARALFEAACARDFGKGCHMLGVQIAEGMIPDEGAGAAEHYRRGCALDYPRSCAALADLARSGQIVADADRLEAKACRLAGPDSSYCRARE